MKKLFTILFLILSLAVSGANRYATSGDVATYAAVTNGRMTVNDYIFDTPTSTSGGLGQIFSSNIATSLGSLRFGGTIWFDAASLPDLFNLILHNNNVLWTGISDADHPVRFCPLGGQIRITMTSASNTGKLLQLADIPYMVLDGFTPSHPGVKYPWSGPLHGTFGFQIDAGTILSPDPFMVMIDGPVGMKTIDVRNVEVSGGFCLFRIMPGNTDLTLDRLSLVNVYGHDSGVGEGGYLMQTTGTPYAKSKTFIMRDCIWARTAAEFIQIQHCYSDATLWSIQEHFIGWASGVNWRKPFEPFQDAGIQEVNDEGKVKIWNFILDFVPNSAVSIINASGGTPTDEPVWFKNGLINDVGDLAVYGNSSMTHGVKHLFENLYFRQANNTYNEKPGATVHSYFVSMNGSDPNDWKNITSDNSKTNIFQDLTDIDNLIGTTTDNSMPAPQYNHPPFPGRIASQFGIYTEDYENGTKVVYQVDDIVRMDIVGTGMRFYNCILGHTSSGSTHPNTDATHWEPIQFDEDGDATYEVDFDAGDNLTYEPWDDLRLVADDPWNIKGFGLRANFRNTDVTTFQWFVADDSSGTNTKELAGEKDPLYFERNFEDISKYVRCRAHIKLAGGSFVDEWLNSWTLVN